MKKMKKILAFTLSVMFVVLCFVGCSASEQAEEITDETMLVAYTAETKPFLYKDENGKMAGFDVELFKAIFDSIKGDYKNYEFVQVEEGYKIGEDTAYTDKDGNEYTASIMIGAVQTNSGSFNEDYSFTEPLISNKVVTVVNQNSKIANYADLAGTNVGVVGDTASAAFDKNSTIKDGCKQVKTYSDAAAALNDLTSGAVDAVVIDEFSLNSVENADSFVVLNGELDTINYVFACKKYDGLAESMNEAIYELKSLNYGDADDFTPMVEKYFGYNASDFNYEPSETE